MEAIREFVTLDIGASTSQLSGDQRQYNDEITVHSMPPNFDSSTSNSKKVSLLKEFLQSILSFLKNDEALTKLSEMVEICSSKPRKTATETPKLVERVVQHVAPQIELVVEKAIN